MSARRGGGRSYLENILAHLPEISDLNILIFAPPTLTLPNDSRIKRGKPFILSNNPILRSFWEIIILPKLLERENADVLFCPGGLINSAVPARCKTVTTFQNMIPFDENTLTRIPFGLQKIRNYLLKIAMLRSMKSADLTIFISAHARSVIEQQSTVRNAVTISHGIDVKFRTMKQECSRPNWLPRGQYLLYVSQFDYYKHQLEVATAFSLLPKDLRDRYSLLLIGDVHYELTANVRKFAVATNLTEKIKIVGAIDNSLLPAAYHHAEAIIFASSCENCPITLLEAMGAGRPIVCSDVMPMPEFGGKAVEYFSPSDANSIRDSLVRVLRSEALKIKLASMANERSNEFDWSVTAWRTWNAMFEIISR
jgi:glycosyltransferase involved in cell wall biosynthesis